jgi:hypothetical protein
MIKEPKFEGGGSPEKSREQSLEELSDAVNKIKNIHERIISLEEKFKSSEFSNKEKESINKEIIDLLEQLSRSAYGLPEISQGYHDKALSEEENAG